MPVPDCEPCWSWPIHWSSSLVSDLPHHYGPFWWSLGCVWPWLALLDLILTCASVSWLEVGPVSSPQGCLVFWTLGYHSWACPACLTGGLWAGEDPDLAATLSPSVPRLLGSSWCLLQPDVILVDHPASLTSFRSTKGRKRNDTCILIWPGNRCKKKLRHQL